MLPDATETADSLHEHQARATHTDRATGLPKSEATAGLGIFRAACPRARMQARACTHARACTTTHTHAHREKTSVGFDLLHASPAASCS